jgi:hypothetical protein
MTTNATSTIKLTDAQLVALSAASQRADRCIVPPEHLKGGAVAKFTGSLIAKRVAAEVDASLGLPIIRRDGDRIFALVITAAGFAALGIEAPDATDAVALEPGDPGGVSQEDGNCTSATSEAEGGNEPIADDRATGRSAKPSVITARSATPREGTKLAQVIALLERAEGAGISELMSATGWLAHTTRAALTGLRKRGYTVELEKGTGTQESRYRITAMPITAKAA